MKVHYPKLYNMAHLSLNVFTVSKGSNNYILFSWLIYMSKTNKNNTCVFGYMVFSDRINSLRNW